MAQRAQMPSYLERGEDINLPSPPAPLACHPGVVGPLPALAVVVTLAESLVDCLLSGERDFGGEKRALK